MLTDIRLLSQQLAAPQFDDPKALVSWMGAVQAQDYGMAKWAVGLRLRQGQDKRRAVEEALRKGEIVRIHVLRPTWHLVAAEDVRWMLLLSGKRIRAANESLGRSRHPEFTEAVYRRGCESIEKALEGGNSLTKEELGNACPRKASVPTPRA